MGFPGGPELLIVLVVVMLLFGATRLPKLARSMGQAGKEFKEGIREGNTEGSNGSADIAGPCPFCDADVPATAKFCPGCARSGEAIVAERVAKAPQTA